MAHLVDLVPANQRSDYAAALAAKIRGNRGTTCCLHIVLDDDNIADSHVAFCIQWAAERDHVLCVELALLLAHCSLTQRKKVARLAWERYEPVRFFKSTSA